MDLYIKNRELVVPGEKLAKGDYLLGEGTFRKADEIYASVMGLVDTKERFIKVIPLSGKYVPHFKPGKELRERVNEGYQKELAAVAE